MITNAVISGSKPREKPFKLADGGALHLLITPTGSRWWRLRFRVHGKEQMLSLGTFPEVLHAAIYRTTPASFTS